MVIDSQIWKVAALRYLGGTVAVAAGLALMAGLTDWRVAAVGVPVLLLFMFAAVVFVRFAADEQRDLGAPASVLLWFAVVIIIVLTVLFLLTFFVRPDRLRDHFMLNSFHELVGWQPPETIKKRNAVSFIAEFDEAIGGAASPELVAQALERTATFWRGDEQRAFLLDYRCNAAAGPEIFQKAKEYVLSNAALRKDIDTVTRYYDSVARCVRRSECDAEQICGYFYQQMDDFQRLYGRYFRELAALERRDPISNIRDLIFNRCQAPAGAPKKIPTPACDLLSQGGG